VRTGAPNIVTKNTYSDNIHSEDIISSDNITIVHQKTVGLAIIQGLQNVCWRGVKKSILASFENT